MLSRCVSARAAISESAPISLSLANRATAIFAWCDGRGCGLRGPWLSSSAYYLRAVDNIVGSRAKNNHQQILPLAARGKRSPACREDQHVCASRRFQPRAVAAETLFQLSRCPSSECSPCCGNAAPVLASLSWPTPRPLLLRPDLCVLLLKPFQQVQLIVNGRSAYLL